MNDNDNNVMIFKGYIVYLWGEWLQLQAMLQGPHINNIPFKNHVIVLLSFNSVYNHIQNKQNLILTICTSPFLFIPHIVTDQIVPYSVL